MGGNSLSDSRKRSSARRSRRLTDRWECLLFSTMDQAARFESCDWQLPIREGEFISMLLPELQQSRTWARLLSAKARLEIAEEKYDQAVRTLQTGLAAGQA